MIRKCLITISRDIFSTRPDVSKKAIVCVFVHFIFQNCSGSRSQFEKIPNLVKADGANVKMNSTATPAVPSCSTSSSAVSTPPVIKPVLMSKSVPPSPEDLKWQRNFVYHHRQETPKRHQKQQQALQETFRYVSVFFGNWLMIRLQLSCVQN